MRALIAPTIALALAACGPANHHHGSVACFATPSGVTLCGQAADSYCAQDAAAVCLPYGQAKAALGVLAYAESAHDTGLARLSRQTLRQDQADGVFVR